MKNTIKMVISHFFIITTSVTAVLGVCNYFSSDFTGYPREFPLYMLLIGATSALPSFLFYFRGEPTRSQFIVRVVLHFLCILAVVLGEGWLIGWYDSPAEMAFIVGIVVLVYIIVWVVTMHSNSKAEQGINEALKRYNEEDE